ncbi:hypothetical protein FXO38_28580 [Capsicum annuum]|nr:hypothetical protein FXO38_28580 [Capsicum annuum]
MAAIAGGTIPPNNSNDEDSNQNIKKGYGIKKYVDLLKPIVVDMTNIRVPPKPISMLHREPSIRWKSSEVRNLIMQENLQYDIIGKFSYGNPHIEVLRKIIPNQYSIKGQCTIGVLDERQVLFRLEMFEDYVQLLSTATYYIG